MRKFLLTLTLFFVTICTSYAQAPDAISYQAAAYDSDGKPVSNQVIGIRISVLDSLTGGTTMYSERQTVRTSDYGTFSLLIGTGNTISGTSIGDVSWGAADAHLMVEIDINGGTNYSLSNVSQLVSVPYALSSPIMNDSGWLIENGAVVNKNGLVGIGTESPDATLTVVSQDNTETKVLGVENSFSASIDITAASPFSYSGSYIKGYRARGSLVSPSNILDGDRLGGTYFYMYQDSEYAAAPSTAIESYAGTGVGTGSHPGFIRFGTTPSGSVDRINRMIISQDGRVGIGTESPAELLSVAGTIESTAGGMKFPDGSVQTTAFTGYAPIWSQSNDTVSYASGVVGIGTTSPNAILSVVGQNDSEKVLSVENSFSASVGITAASALSYAGSYFKGYRARGSLASPSNIVDGDRLGGTYFYMYQDSEYAAAPSTAIESYAGTGVGTGSHPGFIRFGTTPSGSVDRINRMIISQDGRVGIGTESPSELLSVAGTIESTTGGMKFPDGTIQTSAAASAIWNQNSDTVFYNGGFVGIGTNSPSELLSVAGIIESTTGGVKFPDGSVQTTAFTGYAPIWSQSNDTVSYASGVVGIGTTSPNAILSVVGQNDSEKVLSVENSFSASVGITAASALSYAGSYFKGYRARGSLASPSNIVDGDRLGGTYFYMYQDSDYAAAPSTAIESYAGTGVGTGSHPGYILFGTTPSGSTSRVNRMIISQDGMVGIGTESPTAKLTVADGDVYVTDSTKGIILTAPGGGCFRVTVDNAGNLSTSSITCP